MIQLEKPQRSKLTLSTLPLIRSKNLSTRVCKHHITDEAGRQAGRQTGRQTSLRKTDSPDSTEHPTSTHSQLNGNVKRLKTKLFFRPSIVVCSCCFRIRSSTIILRVLGGNKVCTYVRTYISGNRQCRPLTCLSSSSRPTTHVTN